MLLLCSFKEQLQQHVRVHAMEAVMACWEIEQSLQSLTGEKMNLVTSFMCVYEFSSVISLKVFDIFE